jgi:archaellum biogenesis ATPase FlaH
MLNSRLINIIQEELERIGHRPGLYILLCRGDAYLLLRDSILKDIASEQENKGLFITLNTPYKELIDKLKKEKINTKHTYFIDCITKSTSKASADSNCTYIQDPGSLTELSLAISEQVQISEANYIVFDSVSTLLLYNSMENSERFLHYLFTKLKTLSLKSIVIAIDEPNTKKAMPLLSQFADKIMDIP